MDRPPKRFDRARYLRARIDFGLSCAAGSVAWSPAGRGSVLAPGHRLGPRAYIELGDRALPILHRN